MRNRGKNILRADGQVLAIETQMDLDFANNADSATK